MLRPHLERRIVPAKAKGLPKPKGVQLEGLDEMARLAASLEHLPVAAKLELGGWILERLRDPALNTGPWAWALGRLGTRELLFGGQQSVIPPEAAGAWLTELLRLNLGRIPGAAFAAAQMARRTEDRLRDLDPEYRRAAIEALRTTGASPRWVQFVEEVVVLDAADEAQALGDSLPLGLTLRS
jgi:hypothetical protein